MVSKGYDPPSCPGCGEPLEFVHETTHCTYKFDPGKGCYSADGCATVDCGGCGHDLRGMPEFESGACNYQGGETAGKRKPPTCPRCGSNGPFTVLVAQEKEYEWEPEGFGGWWTPTDAEPAQLDMPSKVICQNCEHEFEAEPWD